MTALTPAERRTLDAAAALLIPAGAQMPSGADAEVASTYIDRVFGVRPDLIDAVRSGLADLPDPLPASFTELSALGIDSLRPLAEAVTAAYFLNPEVARLVGYRTRSVIPIRFDDDLDDLVDDVVARGPIYRPTPEDPEQ